MEASSIGLPPHLALDYTYAWLHVLLEGEQKRMTRMMQVAVFAGWHNQNLKRHRKLPQLQALLRKLEPVRVMSARALRGAILNMAKAMGAEVVVVKRRE